jgi:hypothetical protein
MKIETKYSVNDKVWFYLNGKAVEAPIYRVDVEVYENSTNVRYMVNVGTTAGIKFELVKEELVFADKQSLIDSL